MVVLMRTAQARAADLPVTPRSPWQGLVGGLLAGVVASDVSSQLLALRRAYERAGVDPRDAGPIEGHGSRHAAGDDGAELLALSELRAGRASLLRLGSIKANIGDARGRGGPAHQGRAGPRDRDHPAPGCIRCCAARTRPARPTAAEEWPGRLRVAGVSAMDGRMRRARGAAQRAEPRPPL